MFFIPFQFVDEGEPRRLLLLDFRARIEKESSDPSHPLNVYAEKLLAAFVPPVDKHSAAPALAEVQTPGKWAAGASVKNPTSEMVKASPSKEAKVRQARTMLVEPEDGQRRSCCLIL